MICSVWMKKVNELKKFPVVFVHEDNIPRVNEETQLPFLTDWAQRDHVPPHLINKFVQSAIKYINDKRIREH